MFSSIEPINFNVHSYTDVELSVDDSLRTLQLFVLTDKHICFFYSPRLFLLAMNG